MLLLVVCRVVVVACCLLCVVWRWLSFAVACWLLFNACGALCAGCWLVRVLFVVCVRVWLVCDGWWLLVTVVCWLVCVLVDVG